MTEDDYSALIIHRKYADKILDGKKKWELRTKIVKKRGKIYILSNQKVIGSVEIVDVKGPFSIDELKKHYDKHKVSEKELLKYSKGKPLYAWILKNPKRLKKEITLEHKKGTVVWRKLTREEIELIRKYEE